VVDALLGFAELYACDETRQRIVSAMRTIRRPINIWHATYTAAHLAAQAWRAACNDEAAERTARAITAAHAIPDHNPP
jgi:hypothetical protein